MNWKEMLITRAIKVTGYSAIVFVVVIFLYLMREGLPTLREVPLHDLLRG